MVSQTLVIKAHNQQLFSMFCRRGLICSVKDFYFVVVLLSAIFILVTCKQCLVNEVQNQLECEACRSYRSNFDNSPEVFDGHVVPQILSRHSVQQHSLENVCLSSNSFCFPSTLTEFLVNEIDAESEASDASGVQSEDFSSGLEQMGSKMSWSHYHGIFRFLGGQSISCSLYPQDGFHEFPSSGRNMKSGQQADVSSCISPLFDKKTQSSNSVENTETIKYGLLDGLSTPLVEIKPSLLEWGHKNMYYPSLAFLTVKNVHADSVLRVYDTYSSNSQFYPCNSSEIFLAPGEIASICFVFFPTNLGSSLAQLVLQTSFGGFLIQAKGFAIESPYLVKPLSDLDISSSGRWRKNLSLFNPFDEALYVEEVTAWISTFSGSTSHSSKYICRVQNMEQSSDYGALTAEDWLSVEREEVGQPKIALRPHKNWEVGPKKIETIMELDISDHFEGKIVAAFCLQFLRSPNKEVDTVMVPLEAELSRNSAPDTGHVSLSLDALVPCNTSGWIVVALSVRNDAPYLLRFMKVTGVGESVETFQIKSVEGLILFPSTSTQVAILSYSPLETHEVNMNCKLLVLINDTRSSQIEIPCDDVIKVGCQSELESSVGHTKGINSIDYINGRERFFSHSMQSPSRIKKAVDTREADELVLRNWKSQATGSFMSVLGENELIFPVVLVGNYCSQWIAVKNPSEEPVLMQLILNSGEVIDKCRITEMLLQTSSSHDLVSNKSIAPTRYGFSIPSYALTEALVHPYGSATFGPILFQPSNRCEWRSSALIRNNLSGVEWLPMRGLGGSLSLVLYEGYDPVQSLEFKLKLPTWLNFSSLDSLHSAGDKTSSCSQPLTKEVYAKNMGDFPLDVLQIDVSGAECGLDGFIIHNCNPFSLQPGESVRFNISYQTDFAAATIQRDLELVLASGIIVIPMKASIPICVLHFCRRSMFWTRVKKAILVILFAAFLLIFLLFPHVSTFASQDFKSGGNSFSYVPHALKSLYVRFNWKSSGAVSPQMNGFVRSIDREEALLLESAGRCSEGLAPDQGPVRPSVGYQKQTNSLLDTEQETRSVSATLSRPSSAEKFDMQSASDSRHLTVRVGKEKGRRRRKKKSSGAGVLLFEVSSSQSGNSTPSPPLSPATSTTPKRSWSVSPGMEQSVEARNPFSQAPLQQSDKNKCSGTSSNVKFLDNEVPSGRGNSNSPSYAQEKPSLPRKVAGRAVLLSSATFPSAGRAVTPWTCHSPFLASTSRIAPHARAPGTKLHNRETGRLEEKMGIEKKYTYDIWGDHLFGLPLTHQSKDFPSISPSAIENNSESFFVRGPQTLMTNSLLEPVTADLEGNKN
ncbi:hypothetical protein Salat_2447100 [Sesamum alatum]|uniref:Transmembrane protein n=1 Tax=Sesamum alatum TaxID=300844 RepID=A0AAE1XQQ5_9LAMI|nr:hypothetical protein Salat_2447100 [Sesamum alatum]